MTEKFISGYCRALDGSRTVTVETDAGELTADCAYETCPHKAACPIGKQIAALTADENS